MPKIVRMGADTPEKIIEVSVSPLDRKTRNVILRYARSNVNTVLLWMQFSDLESMEEFGQTLVDYARSHK